MPNKVRVHVLVADDIAETRENIRKLLAFEKSIIVVGDASNGREAVQLAQELKPDVILMDINMPDLDGLTATEKVRQLDPGIQIVILSVQGGPEYMRRAMMVGAVDYLTKPPMSDELIDAILRAGKAAHEMRKRISPRRVISPAQSLEAAQVEISSLDVSDRIRLYQEDAGVGKLVDKIERVLTGVAHDIKSPLGIAASIVDTIQLDNYGQSLSLERIARRLAYAKYIADTFLGMCISEKPTIVSLALAAVIDDVLRCAYEQIPRDVDIQFIVDVKENVKVRSDRNLLKLVLLNLVMNAIENIGKSGGKVMLYVEERHDAVQLSIANDGPPFSGDKSKFFRIGHTNKSGHTGIGLYVARRLGSAIGIDVRSENETVFGFNGFVLVLKNPEPAIKTVSGLSKAKKSLNELNQSLAGLRKIKLPAEQAEALEKNYQRYIGVFTYSLVRELLIINTLVLNLYTELPESKPEVRDAVLKIARNCIYCRLLASNLLEIQGGEKLIPEKISVIDVVQEVLLLAARKLPEDLYTTTLEIDPRVPEIIADQVKLMQVFMNLVKNAADAMPHGGHLHIAIDNPPGQIRVRVADTGGGIAPENLPRLFELGFSTKPNGYGIGLYSVRQIVTKHGGTVEVTSQEGKGTTFTVCIPLLLDPAA